MIGPNVWCTPEKPAGPNSLQLVGRRETTDLTSGTTSATGVTFLPELVSERSSVTAGAIKRRVPRVNTASFISSSSSNAKESLRARSNSAGSKLPELRSLPPSFASESVKLVALMLGSLGVSIYQSRVWY